MDSFLHPLTMLLSVANSWQYLIEHGSVPGAQVPNQVP